MRYHDALKEAADTYRPKRQFEVSIEVADEIVAEYELLRRALEQIANSSYEEGLPSLIAQEIAREALDA